MTARTPAQAIAWAEARPTCRTGYCCEECRDAYNLPSNGREGTANLSWLDTPAHLRHKPTITPWPGLLAHYAKDGDPHVGDGHITLVKDATHDISTDMLPGRYAPGHRSVVPRSDIVEHMGLRLIGFSEQIEGDHVAPKPTPKPAKKAPAKKAPAKKPAAKPKGKR